jgi:hypothetical protein
MRLQVLFAAALLGVLTALGVALSALGWPVVAAYAVVVVGGVALVAARGRRKPETGRTCACCTTTVFDPVEVR